MDGIHGDFFCIFIARYISQVAEACLQYKTECGPDIILEHVIVAASLRRPNWEVSAAIVLCHVIRASYLVIDVEPFEVLSNKQ
jgi:hypothetical protein